METNEIIEKWRKQVMEIVRNGVFETNSSSTHAIIVAKELNENEYNAIPTEIEFVDGIHFDHSYEIYRDANSKFTYLLLAMSGMKYKDFESRTNLIKEALEEYGVEKIVFPEIEIKNKDKITDLNECKVALKEKDSFEEESYIDHSDTFTFELYNQSDYEKGYLDAGKFLSDILKSKESVIRYLFGNSIITTGSDNAEGFLLPSTTNSGNVYGFPPDDYNELSDEEIEFKNTHDTISKSHNIYYKYN